MSNGTLYLLLAFNCSVAVAAEPATQLPVVTVRAEAPFLKVAEFSLLEPRFAPAAVAQGDYVYVVGGMHADDAPSRTIERLNVHTGRSEVFARLKFPHFWHGAVISGGKLFVIGGAMPGGIKELSRDPHEAEKQIASAGKKYRDGYEGYFDKPGLKGGTSVPIPFVEVVDLETGAVEHGNPLPKPVYAFGCVGVGDQIAVIGGQLGPYAPSQRVSIYDPQKGGWTLGPMLPVARQTVAVIQGPLVIVAGGYTGIGPVADVDVFDLRDSTWRSLLPLVRSTSAHSMVALDNYMFLFGDYRHPEELIVYNLIKQTSDVFTLGYTPARHTAAVTHGRKIYIVGGRALRVSGPLKTVQVFALRKDVASPVSTRSAN